LYGIGDCHCWQYYVFPATSPIRLSLALWQFSLHRLERADLSGSLYQLLQYGVSTLLGLSVLYLLSLRDWGLARVGQRSMYVFLWHGMALIALHQLGILNRIFQMGDTARLLISLASSAVIVYLGSHRYCEKFTQKCI
jgi:fucose 4-O-acetylase-like acetyltransferase